MAEPAIPWRTLRPYIVHEIEPGRAPEVKPHPWLEEKQMALARRVMASELARSNHLDLTGERYGRLLVLRIESGTGKKRMWRCRCVCGRSKLVPTCRLRSGTTQSCGCLFLESARRNAARNRPKAMAAIRAKSAKKKGQVAEK